MSETDFDNDYFVAKSKSNLGCCAIDADCNQLNSILVTFITFFSKLM